MNQNEEIIKEARKFADDLCKNLNKFNAQQDGSCHICGSRPQTFVDYLEKVLKESDQQWLDKIKRAMPEERIDIDGTHGLKINTWTGCRAKLINNLKNEGINL